jgi:secreted Zn-dependent insulinase-like peptidase
MRSIVSQALAGAAAVLLAASPLKAEQTVMKSPNDDRVYEAFVLPNGLKALVISDPSTDKAAAALDVHIGSGSDPVERQGLAHFLEHMLFLGTEQFPEPGEYQRFIGAHGGSHNAYTAFEHTNYFFDIDADYLEPALDRFSQFFVAPLFNPMYVDRERHAVDSEYRSKIMQDGRRRIDAYRQLVNPQHPYAKFPVGSLQTLADEPPGRLREDLIRFYEGHYSSDIMSLVVLGKESTQTLREWVLERFNEVQKNPPPPVAAAPPLYLDGTLPVRLDIVPNKDLRTLMIGFPIPPVLEHYKTKPTFYISNLLGHEGKGSLLSVLKEEGWSDGLSSGTGLNTRHEATLNLNISLTEEGFRHVSDIVAYVFQYLRLLESEGVEGWIFDEQQKLAEISFEFQEETNPIHYVSGLAQSQQVYPQNEVLRGNFAMERFDRELIREYLGFLRPDNMMLSVIAKGLATDQVSPKFHTPYRRSAITADMREAWLSGPMDYRLAMPTSNIFIPESLGIAEVEHDSPRPTLIREGSGLSVWHKQDQDFKTPRADFFFSVRSPIANDTARHSVLTSLYVDLVSDQLNEFAYPAMLAGLEYSLYKHIRGFSVRISGYSDKQTLLLERIVNILKDPTFDEERFDIYKEQFTRDLQNSKQDRPYSQTMSEVTTLLLRPTWTEEQQLAALEPLSAGDLRAFVPELHEELEVIALSHGNADQADAMRLSSLLEEHLVKAARATRVPEGQVVKLASGDRYVRQLDIAHDDSSVVVYFQGPDRSYPSRARVALLAQVLRSHYYHDLRTEKQLGYVVFSTPMTLLEAPGLGFVVQSPNTDPIALEKYTEEFIRGFAGKLDAMDESEFQRYKGGLLTRIMEEDKTISDRTDRYWRDIDRQRFAFDSRERLAEAVEGISKPDFAAFYHELLVDEGRRQIVVRSVGEKHKDMFVGHGDLADETLVPNPQTFRHGKKYFSVSKPALPDVSLFRDTDRVRT